jgi:MFS family permease
MDCAAQNREELAEPASKRIKWPKWALAIVFRANRVGFGTWATHVPVFKQFLHIENGSLTLVLTSFIVVAIASMPITGQVTARYGSRRVIQIVAVGSGIIVAAGPMFFRLALSSPVAGEENL